MTGQRRSSQRRFLCGSRRGTQAENLRCRSHDSSQRCKQAALWSSRTFACGASPGERRRPLGIPGHPSSIMVTDPCCQQKFQAPENAGLSRAPAGSSPSVTNRQSAVARRRATATIPTRRMRLPLLAKRRLNHWVSLLCGCRRTQLHANSTSSVRALVARLADALLDLAVAAGVRGRH